MLFKPYSYTERYEAALSHPAVRGLVTGATYSSEGIISNVQAGIACYLESKGKGGD